MSLPSTAFPDHAPAPPASGGADWLAPGRATDAVEPGRNRPPARKILLAASLFPPECFRGIARFAREHDWHLVTDMLFTGTLPRGWNGSGVLALAPYQPDLLAHVLAAGFPCVAFGTPEQAASVAGVQPDHREIGRLAADHLLERGHRNFAWAPFLNDAANRDRLAGYQARLVERGASCRLLPSTHTRVGPYWQENWAEQRRGLIAELLRLPRPVAIFAFNDCAAVNLVDACRDAGLAVPEDVAVLGSGNTQLAEVSPVPLSSVDENLDELGYRGAALLEEILSGTRGAPAVVVVPPRGVVTRASSGVVAAADARVARALDHITENYHDPMLTVCAVAEAVGTSRRNLERSFREGTGCTINDHIVRTRMSEASRLLKTYPRTRITDVAALVGINDAGTFCRAFRRYYGVSPQSHRAWPAAADDAGAGGLAGSGGSAAR